MKVDHVPVNRDPSSPVVKVERASPLFLERQVYRRRRLIDAARWLPLAGLMLFVGPALLLGTPHSEAEGGSTAMRLIYFFFVWFCLIGVNAVLTRGLVRGEAQDQTNATNASRVADTGEQG